MIGWFIVVGFLGLHLGIVIGFIIGVLTVKWWLKKKLEAGELEDWVAEM